MSATYDLFTRWKKQKSIPSDNAGALALGVSRASASLWKQGRNADADVIERMAKDIGESPAAWAARAMAEQSKGEAARAWARIARQLGAAAAVLAVVLMVPVTYANGMVGRDGFEPSTSGLKVRCSTD